MIEYDKNTVQEVFNVKEPLTAEDRNKISKLIEVYNQLYAEYKSNLQELNRHEKLSKQYADLTAENDKIKKEYNNLSARYEILRDELRLCQKRLNFF